MKHNTLIQGWVKGAVYFIAALMLLLFATTIIQFAFLEWPLSNWIFAAIIAITVLWIAVSLNIVKFRSLTTDSNGFVLNYGLRLFNRFYWNDVADIYYVKNREVYNGADDEFKNVDMTYERARFNLFSPVSGDMYSTVCICFKESSGKRNMYISMITPSAFVDEAAKYTGRSFAKN